MSKDLYQTLGVSRDASQREIKKRYRALAKTLHPDLNPGRADIAERFRELNSAYSILVDPKQRARYDLGEIDGSGAEASYRYDQGFKSQTRGSSRGSSAFSGDDGLQDFFADLFGSGIGRGGGARAAAKGEDRTYRLSVGFLEAAKGGKARVKVVSGRKVDLKIPPGIDSGQTLRLKGQGDPGLDGGPPGDILVEIAIKPHPLFQRKDKDIHLDLPVSLPEAVFGAKVQVPTIDGPVTVNVPKGASSGTSLRLKGRGVYLQKSEERGDQYVRLMIKLPKTIDSDLATFLQRWSKDHGYDPRDGMAL